MQDNCSLYDISNTTAGFIKFYNEEIENDGLDSLKLFHMNIPGSSFQNVLDSLRSKRPMILIDRDPVGEQTFSFFRQRNKFKLMNLKFMQI